MGHPIDSWDPLQDLISIRNRFMELIDRSFRDEILGEGVGVDAWAPQVDFYQTEKTLVLQAEIPGMERKNIEISFAGDRLTIKGDRAATFSTGQAAVHRLERQHGPFRRVIDLPVSIDAERIEATYEAGVLTIAMPIVARTKEKKIRIHTS
jgi:HSP20 family protein